MAVLQKEIIPENTYKVRTNNGRLVKTFDEAYLRKVAETSNKMIENGLRIPAPFDHHKEAKPRTETEIAENKVVSSYKNAGYWRKFWVAPNPKNSKPTLFGELEVDDKDAEDIKKKNEEVSVSISSNFEDGLARVWNDGLMHVALVNHAVVPGQDPFKDAPDNVTVVNMSMIDPGSNDESLIEELKSVLTKVKVTLPSSTNSSTFLRDLLVALSQVPTGSQDQIEPVPIYMSSTGDNDMPLSEDQAKALVGAKTVNPATNKPFTMEDLGFKVKQEVPQGTTDDTILASLKEKDKKIDQLVSIVSAFKNKFTEDATKMLQQRANALVTAGIVTKEWVKEHIEPKLEFQMSIADGKIQDHPLDIMLSALETKMPTKAASGLPSGSTIEELDLPDGVGDMDDSEINKALDELESAGLL